MKKDCADFNFAVFAYIRVVCFMLPIRCIFFFLFISVHAFSQDKIILVSGTEIDGKVLSITEDTIFYQTSKKGKTKEIFLESYRVFSIQYENGKEEIMYKQDTIANFKTEEELRNFIAGEQDALRGYTPYFATITALAVASVGAFFLHNFLVFAVPFVTYMIVVIASLQRVEKNSVRDPNLLVSPDYIDGYMRVVKNKKNRNALWGSIIGAGAGFAVYAIFGSRSGY